jgi:signal peptidase I
MGRAITLLIAGALFAVWLFTLRPDFMGGPAGYVIVSGRSMEPGYSTGDLVVTRKGDYKQGDVVAFRQGSGGLVIHRIVGGDAASGFVTKGDNRSSVDEWRPRDADLIGRTWLHVPGAGSWLAHLRNPAALASLMGGLTAFTLIGGREVKKRRKGREGHVQEHASQPTPRVPAVLSPLTITAMSTAGAVALVAAYVALQAFSKPTTESSFVERARYTQTTAFDYTIETLPSTLYPQGRIGPISAAPPLAGANEAPVTPAYTRLARALDLGFRYRLESGVQAAVSGTYAVMLWIKAGGDGGWSRSQELLPPTPFSGPVIDGRVRVDLAPIQGLIETVEKETGYTPALYELTIVPRVAAAGRIGEDDFSQTFAPAFTFRYTKTTITPDPQLSKSEQKSIGSSETGAREVGLAGLSMPSRFARILAPPTLVACLAVIAVLAAVSFTGFGGHDAARLRARYGAAIVPVRHANDGRARRVEVASLDDLGRLAQRDGGVIFLEEDRDGDRYFIPETTITYEYVTKRKDRS